MINLKTIPICVINLPERKERLTRTIEECINFFDCTILTNFSVIPGVRASIPRIGIAQAHINAIKHAQFHCFENVLIVEDDVRFLSKNAFNYAQHALLSAPDNFDILLGGIYSHRGTFMKTNNYWNKLQEFCGLHFYIVNCKAYDKIIAFNSHMHIDRWLAKGAKLECYVADTFFATQYDGYSDNTNRSEHYEHLLKKYKVLV